MVNLREVEEGVRPAFEYQVSFVSKYLTGKGLDMGCGNCPLLTSSDIVHFDRAPQPLAVAQVGEERFVQRDCSNIDDYDSGMVDFIFSSHMVEDLPTREAIIECLVSWSLHLREGGYLVLLLPDMQGGRYPKVEEEGNPSHRVNVGASFIEEIGWELYERAGLQLIQIDTIPHDKNCSIDIVFEKKI